MPIWSTIRDDNAGHAAKQAALSLAGGADSAVLTLSGEWISTTVGAIDSDLRQAVTDVGKTAKGKDVEVNGAGISDLDTAGAWMLVRTVRALSVDGSARLTGIADIHRTLVDEVEATSAAIEEAVAGPSAGLVHRTLDVIGRNVHGLWSDILFGLHILGAAVRGSQMKLGRTSDISLAPVVAQIDRMGIRAVPIIVLMSFIIGAIIAQQGAFQLRYFGAEIFVVDLVAILVLREIGVLLTAIMIAGRSGSAITAEIGSMKMREEVDALTVIGLNPIGVLVFPRLVALVVALPLLTFIANFAALAGAMFVAQTYSGIAPEAFIARAREAIDLTTFYAGIIKAPFMAIIIGIIASVEGMKVGGSAESLGARVTSAVVKSIFVVIVVDGLFAMFFAAVDF